MNKEEPRDRRMLKNIDFWHTFAHFAGVLALATCVVLVCVLFPRQKIPSLDYQAILVGILAGLFTLIVGWNIYQMVDWRSEFKKVSEMESNMTKEVNYLHNKTTYNQSLTYGFLSQDIAMTLADLDKTAKKEQMLHYGIIALIQFSQFPDCDQESQSLLNILIEALRQTENISIPSKRGTELIMDCGRIQKQTELNNFDLFINLIKKATIDF